jgi:propanol-preferring alcohol dehydrogenase
MDLSRRRHMKAFQFVEWQKPGEIREVPVPEPGPGQVLIKVGGAGACHSDLHIMEWPGGMLPWELPFTLGHENAGWVEKLGAGVSGFSVGDPVAVYGPWGCGHCYQCVQGVETYCENAATTNGGAGGGGLGLNGGMAEYMLVPSARSLVPLDTLHPREAAPYTDAALTPYHAIKRSLHKLTPRSSVVVIAVGGLGHMAVQILKAMSVAQIIAVDVAQEKLDLAKKVGADHAVLSTDPDAVAKIRELTHGRGAEVVLDFVGLEPTIALGSKLLALTGDFTVVGIGMGNINWNFMALPYEVNLTSTYWGTRSELIEVLALAESGKLKGHMTYYPLEKAAEVYELLHAGKINGRAVITPNG